jgi:hypothetical protein
MCDGLTAIVLLGLEKGTTYKSAAEALRIGRDILEALCKDLASKKCGSLVLIKGEELRLNKSANFSDRKMTLPRIASRTVPAFFGKEEAPLLLSEDIQIDAVILKSLKGESGMRIGNLMSVVGNGLKFIPDRDRFMRRLDRLIEMQFVEKDMWGTYRYLA